MKDKKYIVKDLIEQGIATKTTQIRKSFGGRGYNKDILSRVMREAIHKRMCLFIYRVFLLVPPRLSDYIVSPNEKVLSVTISSGSGT